VDIVKKEGEKTEYFAYIKTFLITKFIDP